MIELFIVLLAINIIGIIACNRIAKARGSRHVIFWTTMGVIFGPLAIPFVLKFTPPLAAPG
jgi:hypothetical protein